MTTVKSVTEKDGVATVVFEVQVDEIVKGAVDEAAKMVAIGLGNQIIVDHMKDLQVIFSTRFQQVITKLLKRTIEDLDRNLEEISKQEQDATK